MLDEKTILAKAATQLGINKEKLATIFAINSLELNYFLNSNILLDPISEPSKQALMLI